jgi:hypothetical protein
MFNYNKILSILFVALLIITSLAGCGGGSSTQTISTNTGSPAGSGNTGTGGSGGTGGTVAGTLLWTAPATNTDGTPATDLSGYKIYYGSTSRNYIGSINIVGKEATSLPLDALAAAVPAPGTYFIAVTAYDASGLESDYSNEVSKIL